MFTGKTVYAGPAVHRPEVVGPDMGIGILSGSLRVVKVLQPVQIRTVYRT